MKTKAALMPVLLEGQRPARTLRQLYNKSYSMWSGVWFETLKELDNAERMFSDDFKRQDEVLVLFQGEEAIASVFFSKTDLTRDEDRKDSYFKAWPEDLLRHLGREMGCEGLICSYFTVAKNWRKAELPYYVKDLIGALAIKRFLELKTPFMVGTMRNNKGMNNIAYSLGADVLLEKVPHHGVEVDLVAFLPEKVNYWPVEPEMKMVIDDIWSRLVSYEQINYIKKVA